MRRLLPLLAAALLALGAGCGGDAVPEEELPPPEETPEAIPGQCSSEEGGYRLEYPSDWFEVDCAWFHPERFEVPEGTEFFGAAVIVSREPVELEEVADETRFQRILEQEETEIDGRYALRMEAESTGEGLLDAGIRYYQVVVEANGGVVIVSTYDLDELEYDRNRQVVDQVAESLELED